MLKVTIRKVNPGQAGKLRDWLAELMRRKDEVRETFKQETVRHEQGYLLNTADGLALIYVIEAEDLEQASEVFKNSTLPIDLEHRQVMEQVLGESIPVELLYDCDFE
ncbi:MAG: DUF6176 family protein [Anaerolineales bacterium]|jgi:hypothetical protein